MKVSDPTGQVWRVSRRWVPWRRRLKGWLPEASSLGAFDVPIIGVILFVVIGIPVLLVLTAALLELLVLLVVFPFAVLVRVAFGRNWVVHARKGFTIWWEEPAGDWRASATRIADVAAAIERGVRPEQNVDRPGPSGPGPAQPDVP